MSLSRKVFLGVFCTSLFVCTALIWLAHHFVGRKAEDGYRERYRGLSRALGRTLTELEYNTEALMLNAAQVLVHEDARRGLLSTEELKRLRERLSVTHVFVTDSKGKFVRSTNEDPKLIPNLFSFCGRYRELVTGESTALGTPIIPPAPEPKPYKFLTMPSLDRSRLIEVGVRVDFIGKTHSSRIESGTSRPSKYSRYCSSLNRYASRSVASRAREMSIRPCSMCAIAEPEMPTRRPAWLSESLRVCRIYRRTIASRVIRFC
jgi:hypothetical protein